MLAIMSIICYYIIYSKVRDTEKDNMRKEGVFFLLIGSALVLVGANYYQLLNAFNLIIFAGVIPVLNLSLPDNLVLACSLAAIMLIMAWPFRDSLLEKLDRKSKSIKQLRPKRRSPETT